MRAVERALEILQAFEQPPHRYRAFTRTTVTDPDTLREELRDIRRRGYGGHRLRQLAPAAGATSGDAS